MVKGTAVVGLTISKKRQKTANFQPKIHFLSQKLPLNLINGANIDIF
jgi:hypothetical protein